MAAKNKVTVSMNPSNFRPSSAERRAAHVASISNKQADLKREFAERAAKRALSANDAATSAPRRPAARRSNAR